MSVYRGVFFFRSDNDDIIYACRRHRGEFNPDKHVDNLHTRSCAFTHNGYGDILRVQDLNTGNIYYPDPSCPRIQD